MTTTIRTSSMNRLAALNEYQLTVAAKYGDQDAWVKLWSTYRNPMMAQLRCVIGLSKEDRESEAYTLFAHKLEIFDPAKVNVSPSSFSFGYMAINGAKNLRDRLVNESRADDALEDNEYLEIGGEDESGATRSASKIREYETMKYSVETLVFRDPKEDMTVRVKRFYDRLNDFQKDVLRLRRAGFKLQEIADELGCSLSRVKDNLSKAKFLANDVFDIAFA